MKTIAIINLKGGVGKSVTACNVAYNMTVLDGKGPSRRVLVIDLDKQANTTKFFGVFAYGRPTMADVLTLDRHLEDVICESGFDGLALAPSNMRMLTANKAVMLDVIHPQHSRLCKELARVAGQYDYCIVDCPPDIDMATINAMCAADYILIPVDCDEWALDGLQEIREQVEVIRENYNPKLEIMGILGTKYTRGKYSIQAVEQMTGQGLPVMHQVTSYSIKVKEAKSEHLPLLLYAPKSKPAGEYLELTKEIVNIMEGNEQ